MKTAYEIAQSYNAVDKYGVPEPETLLAMRMYAEENLKEAAKRANIKWVDIEYDEEKRDMIREPEIDKDSILNLIKELK